MARCRVGYLLALGAAVLFFVCFNGYFSFYVLVLALVFPLFSLLVSLPGMLGCAVELGLSARAVRRNETAEAQLTVISRSRLPVARLTVDLRWDNAMNGQSGGARVKLSGASLGAVRRESLPTGHCGMVRCRAARVRVCDLLGLFAFRRPIPPAAELAVLPLDLPPEPVPALLGAEKNQVMRPRPGGGPGEDYDLRPYRAGDPLRSVHWKLSTKVDALVVRETLEPQKAVIVLSFDHFGTPEDLDLIQDRLEAVSRALIERERPHAVRWLEEGAGRVRERKVSSLTDLRACQWEIFSTPAPADGHTAAARLNGGGGALVRSLHITAGDGRGEEGAQ
ncbi:DUF58 domain-containing protein [uncultured Pseudoflavonifractor sp.]|uniref:DUF58 domain-containing protein n=1 Tax=uncultured Pseudoflavonifractor sp. TaxID=1221379 RepID=UPI0025E68FE1|nr:DUF58 domain-containing protein [uncultured Pseudoflavonifractor sp.]